LLERLPPDVQRQAHDAYALFEGDPFHASLQFKCVHQKAAVYSARIGIGWRALGVRKKDAVVWFWIGSHAEYDQLLTRY
jgi:hypothetical protein